MGDPRLTPGAKSLDEATIRGIFREELEQHPLSALVRELQGKQAQGPVGVAGGDLSGSYPNPVVAKLGGVAATVDTWLKLAAGADRKVNFGVVTLDSGGPTAYTSQTKTVAHGLGVVPIVVLATAEFGAWTSVNANIDDATNFRLSGRTLYDTTAGQAAWPNGTQVSWVAIG